MKSIEEIRKILIGLRGSDANRGNAVVAEQIKMGHAMPLFDSDTKVSGSFIIKNSSRLDY